MKYLVYLYVLFLVSCTSSYSPNDLQLYDTVKFKFSDRNLFYKNRCEDVGTVKDVAYDGKYYFILTLCSYTNTSVRVTEEKILIVDRQDIVDVLHLKEK